MNGLPETIADFIELRRSNANTLERAAGGKPNQFQRELIADLRDEADRLEAAYRAEKLRWVEANAGLAKLVDLEKIPTGNTAKMREALELVLNALRKAYATVEVDRVWLADNIDIIIAALSEPPRNCDRHGGDAKKLNDEWWEWSGDPRNCNDDGTVKLSFGEWLLEKAKEVAK